MQPNLRRIENRMHAHKALEMSMDLSKLLKNTLGSRSSTWIMKVWFKILNTFQNSWLWDSRDWDEIQKSGEILRYIVRWLHFLKPCMHNIQTQQKILTTLLGGNVNTRLKDNAQQQMEKLMIAHIYLLINVFTNHITKPTSWTKLSIGITVATQDIEWGKLMMRSLQNDTIAYTSIREALENLTLPQMIHYNIRLGTASNWTEYTDSISKKMHRPHDQELADNIITFVNQ